MDWFKLLKEPKLRTGSKITTTLGRDSKEDEEGPCFRKLKEYQEKIAGKTYIMDENIKMHIRHELKDMPEEVACAALKLLNKTKLYDFMQMPDNFLSLIVDGTEYHVESSWYYNNAYDGGLRVTMDLEVYTVGINPYSLRNPHSLLYFRVTMRTIPEHIHDIRRRINLNSDKIKEYAEMVNWRDN